MRAIADAASVLGADYDAEVVEMHHRFKKDAPSGTAARLLEIILEERKLDATALRMGHASCPDDGYDVDALLASAHNAAIGAEPGVVPLVSCCVSPNFTVEPWHAIASPATVPGTPMPSAESRDLALSGLPSAPRKMPGVVAEGAVSR